MQEFNLLNSNVASYRNQSIDFKAFINLFDAPQANQLTGFCMRATLAFNGLQERTH